MSLCDVTTSLKGTSHIWLQIPVTCRRLTMECMLRVLRWSSVFAVRLPKRDWTCRLAGLSVRYLSTETAPHIPSMEYQVSSLYGLSSLFLSANQLAS